MAYDVPHDKAVAKWVERGATFVATLPAGRSR